MMDLEQDQTPVDFLRQAQLADQAMHGCNAPVHRAAVALGEFILQITATHHRSLTVQPVTWLAPVLVEPPQYPSLPLPPFTPQSRHPSVSSLAIALPLPYLRVHSKSLRAFEVSLALILMKRTKRRRISSFFRFSSNQPFGVRFIDD